jgi:hypothetical protein
MDILLYYGNSKEKENEMTVRELIEILSQFDGEMEIMVSQNGGEYEGDFSGEVTVDQGRVWFLD